MQTRTIKHMLTRSISTATFLLMLPSLLFSQSSDSTVVDAGLYAGIATKDYQPLWTMSKRLGMIQDTRSFVTPFVSAYSSYRFGKKDSATGKNVWSFESGISAYPWNDFKEVELQTGYLRLNYHFLSVAAGRFKNLSNDVNPDLSIGSFGISGNALPIPQVAIYVDEFKSVPFTKGVLKFKGLFAHGWMGYDRFMFNPYYHEKRFYLQVETKKLQLTGGIEHFVEWGGRRFDYKLDRTFRGFMNVVLVKEADDGSVGTSVNGIAPSRAGDQRGFISGRFALKTKKGHIDLYGQVPFESGEEFDIRNRSIRTGFEINNNKSKSLLSGLVLEFLYTKEMNYFVDMQQRQSYYNNGAYRTGWEYRGMVVGVPVFTNRERAAKYFESIQPFDWKDTAFIPGNQNIINNRLITLHAGASLQFSKAFRMRSLLTYTKNYSDFNISSPFYRKNQCYFLEEFYYDFKSTPLTTQVSVGVDAGQFSNNVGVMIGARYRLYSHVRKHKTN